MTKSIFTFGQRAVLMFAVCLLSFIATWADDVHSGDKIEVNGIHYLVNADLQTLSVTYPTASAPTSGTNTYSGAITVPASVEYGGKEFTVTQIGDFAFQYANITSLTLPEGITNLGQKCIYATQITEITIPNSVTTTAYESLGYNTLLESITFGENIAANKWGDKLCYNPSGKGKKKDVYMRCKAVPSLRTYTFSFAGATIHVYPSMLDAFQTSGDWNVFELVADLSDGDDDQPTVDLHAGDKIEIGGIHYLVNGDLRSLTVTYSTTEAPASGTNTYSGAITVPASVEYGGKEFAVTKIGDFAFQYAEITSLTLPEGITSLGQKCIYATKIKEITLPNSVTTTAYESLGYNTLLESITFGENIAANKWGDKLCYTPSGKKKQVYMRCKAVPELRTYTFSFTEATIHVYSIMVNAFKASNSWNGYEIIGDLLIDYTYEDLQAAITEYSKLAAEVAGIGTDPGCCSESSASALTSAINNAKALSEDATLQQINDAIEAIIIAYDGLVIYPLNEGIYYITNEYKNTNALYGDGDAADTEGLKFKAVDTGDNNFYFRLTRNGGNWNMQCMGNNMYVGTTIDGTGTNKKIALTEAPTYTQIITSVGNGMFTIQTTYSNGTASPTLRNYSNIITTYNYTSGNDLKRVHWSFHPADPTMFEQSYNLENGRVRAYMNNVSYTTSDASKISSYNAAPPARRDQPVPATLFWSRNAASSSQKIILSLDDDFSTSTTIDVPKETASYELYNLVPGNTYYYKVVATDDADAEIVLVNSSFKTEGQVRMIKADGIENIRDLGGWPTASGKMIRYGYIFRGAAFNPIKMSEQDIQSLRNVGIRAELDLRGSGENGGLTASVLGNDVEYKHIPLGQTSTYYAGLTTYKGQYKKDVEYVFNCVKNDVPVYFHCAIGADRTGTLAFLLEGVLGVSESDLYRDYELTTLSGQTRTKGYLDTEVIQYINSMEGASLEEKFQTYFTKELKIPEADIKVFKNKMLVANDDPLGVVSTETSLSEKVNVYTLDGRLVRQQVEALAALRGLQSGIYVVNGKKIKK